MIAALRLISAGERAGPITEEPLVAALDAQSASDESLTIHRIISEIRDVSVIESEISGLLASTDDSDNVYLEALLLRYVELNPELSIRFAIQSRFRPEYAVLMFQALASVNPDLVLTELAAIDDPALVRTIAVGLVGLIDGTANDIDQLSSLIRPVDRAGFVSDALVRLAEEDPRAALLASLRLTDERFREVTVQRVGTEWVKQDPILALNALNSIQDAPLRHLYHLSVVSAWASIDPDGALDYLTQGDGRILFSLNYSGVALVVNKLAALRPYELLATAQDLPGDMGTQLATAALQSIVDQGLMAALVELQAMQYGPARTQLVETIAVSYARENPAEALNWARSLGESSSLATARVIREISNTDTLLAVTIALESSGTAPAVSELLGNLRSLEPDEVSQLADRIAAYGEPQSDSVAQLLDRWVAIDSTAALSWFLDNQPPISQESFARLAQRAALQNSEIAAQITRELPEAQHGAWVTQIAGAYLERDPDDALTWLASFRNDPQYDDWISTIIERMQIPTPINPNGVGNPRVLAQLLGSVNKPSEDAAALVAVRWASSEPVLATQWALSIPDSSARSAGVAAAAGAWTVSNPSSALQWVRSLPSGEVRDRALSAVLSQSIFSHGAIDDEIIGLFSSSAAERTAWVDATRALGFLSVHDPERARSLADAYIDDVAMRSQVDDLSRRIRESGTVIPQNRALNIGP